LTSLVRRGAISREQIVNEHLRGGPELSARIQKALEPKNDCPVYFARFQVNRVKHLSDFSLSTRKFVWLALSVLVICGQTSSPASAQLAERLSDVKRLAVDWTDGGKGSAEVHKRVEEKLKTSGKIQIVQDSSQADAVLHGSAVIWATGYIAMSPRSRSTKEATFQGYASAELKGKSGKTLWSYLVTPRHSGWKSINDDLGDQLVGSLLEAMGKREPGERAAEASDSGSMANSSTFVVKLQGAGATLPAPIYQKWVESFQQTRPEISVSYDAVGSEEGIHLIQAGTVDFGASDMPLTAEQVQGKEGKLLQFATVLGAVVPIYNVKGAPDGLNLTPEVLTGIYLGKITSWNAPEIRAINKHVRLPEAKIVVVHRSDGSGTTFAWTDYLSKVSEEWKSAVGSGTTVSWPVGMGAAGNQGVAETVYKTPNSIGYVEFIYALQHELSFGAVRNGSGEYVKADLDSVTAAAKTAGQLDGKESRVSITNADGKHVYPISTFTWVLIPADGNDSKKQGALRELVRWMLTSGQKECQSLGYAPLPGDVAARELEELGTVK
jgi:phosphate transport system substrate-binding protein